MKIARLSKISLIVIGLAVAFAVNGQFASIYSTAAASYQNAASQACSPAARQCYLNQVAYYNCLSRQMTGANVSCNEPAQCTGSGCVGTSMGNPAQKGQYNQNNAQINQQIQKLGEQVEQTQAAIQLIMDSNQAIKALMQLYGFKPRPVEDGFNGAQQNSMQKAVEGDRQAAADRALASRLAKTGLTDDQMTALLGGMQQSGVCASQRDCLEKIADLYDPTGKTGNEPNAWDKAGCDPTHQDVGPDVLTFWGKGYSTAVHYSHCDPPPAVINFPGNGCADNPPSLVVQTRPDGNQVSYTTDTCAHVGENLLAMATQPNPPAVQPGPQSPAPPSGGSPPPAPGSPQAAPPAAPPNPGSPQSLPSASNSWFPPATQPGPQPVPSASPSGSPPTEDDLKPWDGKPSPDTLLDTLMHPGRTVTYTLNQISDAWKSVVDKVTDWRNQISDAANKLKQAYNLDFMNVDQGADQ